VSCSFGWLFSALVYRCHEFRLLLGRGTHMCVSRIVSCCQYASANIVTPSGGLRICGALPPRLLNNDLERICKEEVAVWWRYCFGIFLQGLREAMNISLDSWYLGRVSKRAPPQYEYVTSPVRQPARSHRNNEIALSFWQSHEHFLRHVAVCWQTARPWSI
jgi:hypothetical protein